ncbi:MAG: carbohydrate ABC transporter permease [Anaerotignum sp.]|nr:carbohydrate ABC transporter permease [Anaerotignum sp.]MBR2062119.1 carbohydrate ABC transporter permease [Anaerotignum sp.]MBR2383123.1 carbohydrate ABC transporter permease [Anaerotignum sp.]MBR3910254.1 carbohydrate ABC transporter permease [Anaerotignum sp.]MBR4113100.1 carbohydrate ABC transporter permease [Anaerotignum sp.]
MTKAKKSMWSTIGTVFFSIICVLYMYPIVMVVLNSLKKETAITTATTFDVPTAETFAGLSNYVSALGAQGFLQSFIYSAFITVSSVALILLCCSMCAWYITRVNSKLSKLIYLLCAFSMVVPFQMVMFTLSQTADSLNIFGLRFNTPWTICFIYLGFGAGLAVFMFSGFVKSIPLELEEAAMIDGCNPLQTYFKVVFPLLKPTMISVGVLETMWVWNDYLLPTLVLDIKKYRTIPMLIQYFRGSYGRVEMGPMMACIVMTVLPVVIIYLLGQKHIIKGVLAGAVKG